MGIRVVNGNRILVGFGVVRQMLLELYSWRPRNFLVDFV